MAANTYLTVPGIVTVRWDEMAQAVTVEWEGPATSEDFGAVLDAEVRALEEHRGSRLLADCRFQRVINLADQDRANREWIPRVAAAGLKQFAIVLPIGDMAATHIRERTGQIPESMFSVGYFTTVQEAQEWLRAERVST
jgi:hypothetical protein